VHRELCRWRTIANITTFFAQLIEIADHHDSVENVSGASLFLGTASIAPTMVELLNRLPTCILPSAS
jgi:hypothetical protein